MCEYKKRKAVGPSFGMINVNNYWLFFDNEVCGVALAGDGVDAVGQHVDVDATSVEATLLNEAAGAVVDGIGCVESTFYDNVVGCGVGINFEGVWLYVVDAVDAGVVVVVVPCIAEYVVGIHLVPVLNIVGVDVGVGVGTAQFEVVGDEGVVYTVGGVFVFRTGGFLVAGVEGAYWLSI